MINLRSILVSLNIFEITNECVYVCYCTINKLEKTFFKVFGNMIYQIVTDCYGFERIINITIVEIINKIKDGLLIKIS